MKNSLIITALLFSFGAQAQVDSKETERPKKIEVIKIVDGDTVMHTVREFDSNEFEREHKRYSHQKHMHKNLNDIEEDIEIMIDDMEIYISADDIHKKMIVRQIRRGDEGMDGIFESLDKNENIVIEFEDGRRRMKVMKIEIDGDGLEEITTIELGPGNVDNKKGKAKGKREIHKESSPIKVYPNPAKDQINLEFEVLEGDAEVNVMDMNGKVIFNKTYKEAGRYKEHVKLNKRKNELLIIELKEKGRLETRKIIIE